MDQKQVVGASAGTGITQEKTKSTTVTNVFLGKKRTPGIGRAMITFDIQPTRPKIRTTPKTFCESMTTVTTRQKNTNTVAWETYHSAADEKDPKDRPEDLQEEAIAHIPDHPPYRGDRQPEHVDRARGIVPTNRNVTQIKMTNDFQMTNLLSNYL